MSIYTTRVLGRSKAAGSAASDTYTVPTGKRFVATCLVAKIVTSGETVLLGLGASAYLVVLKSTAAIQTVQWEGRIAFNAGEDAVVHLDAGEVAYALTGFLLAA